MAMFGLALISFGLSAAIVARRVWLSSDDAWRRGDVAELLRRK